MTLTRNSKIGIAAVLVLTLLAGGALLLRSGGPVAIIFSLVCIGIAAFSFLLDFDAADQMIRAGAPGILRGNASEIMSVAGLAAATRGVDSAASTADASDARRLQDEMAFFAPDLILATGGDASVVRLKNRFLGWNGDGQAPLADASQRLAQVLAAAASPREEVEA